MEEDFEYFIEKGINYWFKDNPFDHWLKNNRDKGWERFITVTVRGDRLG